MLKPRSLRAEPWLTPTHQNHSPNAAEPIGGTTYILPGLKEYREIYNKGNLVFDARLGYKLNDTYRFGFMVNNLFNSEYTSRPGDIQPPRNFSVQVQMKF